MVVLKNRADIEKMRTAGRIVGRVLDAVGKAIRPGISTWDLEMIAESICQETQSKPAFKGYRVGNHVFPCCLCISINQEVVHGIPSRKRILQNGDIVSIDFGAEKDGYFGDAAYTFPVGPVDKQIQLLLDVTRESLYCGIAKMTPRHRLEDIGAAIQQHVEQHHFSVVRDFVGHGIGRKLHEQPSIPNYGTPGFGIRLRPGMVFAIEPMINVGTHEVRTLDDGWTVVTLDGKHSAHFEHTVAITENGPDILTVFP